MLKKKIYLVLIVLAFALLFFVSVYAKSSDTRTPDFSREKGTVTINISFNLKKGYNGVAYSDMTPEEVEKKLAENNFVMPNYEIYKDGQSVCKFYYESYDSSSLEGLPTFFEQKRERARIDDRLLEEGSTDLYEYFLFQEYSAEYRDQPRYVYKAWCKDLEGYAGFSISSESREEAEKIFKSMDVWLKSAQ